MVPIKIKPLWNLHTRIHRYGGDIQMSLIYSLFAIAGFGSWEFVNYDSLYGPLLIAAALIFNQRNLLAKIRDTREIKTNGLWRSGFNICDILQIVRFEPMYAHKSIYAVYVRRKIMEVKWFTVWFSTVESRFIVYRSDEGRWRCYATNEFIRYPIKDILEKLYKQDIKRSRKDHEYKN